MTTVLQTLHQRLPSLMKANLAFWLPAQGFQFAAVPVDDQAVYVAVMGVLWNGVLAVVTTPKGVPEEPLEPEPVAAGGANDNDNEVGGGVGAVALVPEEERRARRRESSPRCRRRSPRKRGDEMILLRFLELKSPRHPSDEIV